MYQNRAATTGSDSPHFMDRRRFIYILGGGAAAAVTVGMMTSAGKEFLSSITQGDQTKHIALSYEGGRKIMAFEGQTYEIVPIRFVVSEQYHEIRREKRVASSVPGLVRNLNPDLSDSEVDILARVAEQLYKNPEFENMQEGDKEVIRFDPNAKAKIVSELAAVPIPKKLEQRVQ